MKIVTVDGDSVRVRRRVLPWRPRVRELDVVDVPSWSLPDLDGELPVVAVILVGVAVVLLLPAVVVGLVVLGEALVLLLLLPAFVLARVAFGKPWIVEVVARRKVVHAEPVVGWGAAGRRVKALAAEIRTPGWQPTPSPRP
ncbi:hypothetical protein ACQP60_11135 [Isoptericola variabilis]|uniref:hypothetical protein n=1 Tax=Isoptericola variabilis TaxID=139208 RepID=UPI003D228F0A